jgi:uncharacterized protein
MVALSIRELKGELPEMATLQNLFEQAPDYFTRITGYPSGPADAQSTYSILPDGKDYVDKFVFGLFKDDEMVGCADVIRRFPRDNYAFVSLLLIAEPLQKKGMGKQSYSLIEQRIRAWEGVDTIRIAVLGTNEIVLPFWQKMGFRLTGEMSPYSYDKVKTMAVYLEKRIVR